MTAKIDIEEVRHALSTRAVLDFYGWSALYLCWCYLWSEPSGAKTNIHCASLESFQWLIAAGNKIIGNSLPKSLCI